MTNSLQTLVSMQRARGGVNHIVAPAPEQLGQVGTPCYLSFLLSSSFIAHVTMQKRREGALLRTSARGA
jgi:hypothetical protein